MGGVGEGRVSRRERLMEGWREDEERSCVYSGSHTRACCQSGVTKRSMCAVVNASFTFCGASAFRERTPPFCRSTDHILGPSCSYEITLLGLPFKRQLLQPEEKKML